MMSKNDIRELKKFGLIMGSAIGIGFGLLLPWHFGYRYQIWPWLVLAVFFLLSIISPKHLNPFYKIWMRFGLIMNYITSRLILGTVYYLAVVPTGIIKRIRKKDPMEREFIKDTLTYRVKSEKTKHNQMEKTF